MHDDINPTLRHFSKAIQTQGKEVLIDLRQQWKHGWTRDPDYETVLLLIDGQIALSELLG